VVCPSCGYHDNRPAAIHCASCGVPIPGSSYADAALKDKVSSAGRQPWPRLAGSGMADTSPRARRAFLDALADRAEPRPGGSSLIERISEAERAAELCEADWNEAHGQAVVARAQSPELAASRSLTPADRHAYVVSLTASEAEQRAEQAYTAARARLAGLLQLLDEVSRPDLGLPPGPL
jgi:hypothetical protein